MAYARKKADPATKKTGAPAKPCVEPKMAEAICNNLELGMPITLAAEAEGIHRQTIYRWMEEFPEFALQVTRAKAAGAKNLVVRALAGSKGSAMAGWMLERRYEEYRPVTKVINAEEDEFAGRTVDELEGERDRLRAKLAAAE